MKLKLNSRMFVAVASVSSNTRIYPTRCGSSSFGRLVAFLCDFERAKKKVQFTSAMASFICLCGKRYKKKRYDEWSTTSPCNPCCRAAYAYQREPGPFFAFWSNNSISLSILIAVVKLKRRLPRAMTSIYQNIVTDNKLEKVQSKFKTFTLSTWWLFAFLFSCDATGARACVYGACVSVN